MNDQDVMLELVSYHKGELSPEENAAIEAHLATSEACRAELDAIRHTFDALHHDLVPIELSAHFRIALTDQIDEATRVASHAEAEGLRVIRPSERHKREMDAPALTRLVDHAKRSPYFAASILLHAAAVFLFLGIYLHLSRDGGETARPTPIITDGGVTPEINLADRQQRLSLAYTRRQNAPAFRTRVAYSPGGLTVNVAQAMKEDGNVVLDINPELRCVVATLADGAGQPASEALVARSETAVISRIQNARLRVPAAIARDFFGANDTIQIFDLTDRLELWSEPTWQSLKDEFGTTALRAAPARRAGMTPAVANAAAILPRRSTRDENAVEA